MNKSCSSSYDHIRSQYKWMYLNDTDWMFNLESARETQIINISVVWCKIWCECGFLPKKKKKIRPQTTKIMQKDISWTVCFVCKQNLFELNHFSIVQVKMWINKMCCIHNVAHLPQDISLDVVKIVVRRWNYGKPLKHILCSMFLCCIQIDISPSMNHKIDFSHENRFNSLR